MAAAGTVPVSVNRHLEASVGQPTRNRPDRAVISLRGQLVPQPSHDLGTRVSWTVEAVRKTFLHDGQLVPPLQWGITGIGDERYAKAAIELAAASRAQTTREAYGRHVRRWLAWAERQGVSPLPADVKALQAYVVERALGLKDGEDLHRDDDGKLTGRLVMGTVAQELAAIARLHELADLPSPTAHPQIRTLTAGLRRTLTTAPLLSKAALTWDLLTELLEAQKVPTSTTALRAAVARSIRKATKATAGQLARLQWSDVKVQPAGITVTLTPRRRGGAATNHLFSLDTDAARLLARWRVHTKVWPGTAVLRDESGKALTRQGLHQIINREGASATPSDVVPPAVVRDRALLLAGWVSALRRSNLSALTWDDLTRTPEGWVVYLNRSKTDQEGNGDTVAIPAPPPESGLADAAAALDEWLDVLTGLWGRDPRRATGVPVFTHIDRHSNLVLRNGRPRAISGEAIGTIVQKWAAAAGLNERVHLTHGGRRTAEGRAPFGAHSLRAGFVTEGLRRHVPSEDLRGQTKHQSDRALRPYYKPARQPDLLAAMAVLGAIARRDDDAPAPEADALPLVRRANRGPQWDTVPGSAP